jgi:7-cyano-7-deazaguanine reductase
VGTHLLRSNCKITHQPDWGSAFIFLEGSVQPTPESLLQYLVSLRHEDHFHEEVCELIYKRLWDSFSPSALMVACLYTRRGGLDICPVRASHTHLLPAALTDINTLSSKLLRQ